MPSGTTSNTQSETSKYSALSVTIESLPSPEIQFSNSQLLIETSESFSIKTAAPEPIQVLFSNVELSYITIQNNVCIIIIYIGIIFKSTINSITIIYKSFTTLNYIIFK